MDVLELPVAVLVLVVKLEGVEIHGGQVGTDDVNRVQMVHGEQAWVTLGLLYLYGVIDEMLLNYLDRTDVLRVEARRGGPWANLEGRLHNSLHLLLSHSTLADLVDVRLEGHFGDCQLLREQAVPCSLSAITELLPCVEQENLSLVALGRSHLRSKHMRHSDWLHY